MFTSASACCACSSTSRLIWAIASADGAVILLPAFTASIRSSASRNWTADVSSCRARYSRAVRVAAWFMSRLCSINTSTRALARSRARCLSASCTFTRTASVWATTWALTAARSSSTDGQSSPARIPSLSTAFSITVRLLSTST
ncbi:MAG: hypothetical protein BWY85_02467 [Firmicutes bacterium ADurb.Bin506]|nr:MAG: hypothetical protein BWY85_02467 [Firmicutes bacterium ADurb.Bin506]